jgi:hypothetical protein
MGSHEDEVPGVTFHFVSSALTGTARPEIKTVRIVLDATVTDDELWEDVKKKLEEGLRLYKGEDFHTAVLDAVKADLGDLQRENEGLTRDLRREKDARVLAEQELERYKTPFAKLGSALRGG